MFSFLHGYFIGGALLIAIGALQLAVPFFSLYFFQNKLGWRKAILVLPLLLPFWEWFFFESKFSMPIFAIYISQAPLNWLIQFVDLFGYYSISFWLILLNVLIALSIDDWQILVKKLSGKKKHKSDNIKDKYAVPFLIKRFSLIIALMFIPPLLYSFYSQATIPAKLGGEVTVSLVQSNNPPPKKYDNPTLEKSMAKYVEMTDSLLKSTNTDLVIWPEAAVEFYIRSNKQIRDYLFGKVLNWNTPLLTGTLDADKFNDSTRIPPLQKYLHRKYKIYNSAVMVTPQLAWKYVKENINISGLKIYRKQNLMPFTEYVPYSNIFPILSNLTLDLGDGANFSAGKGPKSLLFASHNNKLIHVCPIICWDLFYPYPVIEASGEGENFIAALTNESRLGNSLTTTVHEVEGYTRIRSIESRRSIAECSTTGYTFFCDPLGNVYGKVPWWSKQVATANVRLSSISTFYDRYPGYFPKGCLILIAIIFVTTLRKRRK